MSGRSGANPAGRGPSLPPLTQTGEHPKVPSNIGPTGPGQQRPAPSAAPGRAADTVVVAGGAAGSGVFPDSDNDGGVFAAPMPSALPPMDEATEQVADATGVMPSLAGGAELPSTDIDLTTGGPRMGSARGDFAPTDPFPDHPTEFPTNVGDSPPAPQTRSFDGKPMAAAGAIGGVGAMGAPSDARGAARQTEDSAFGAPSDRLAARQRQGANVGVGGMASGRSKRGTDADRLQDTEFKLADKRRKQKPKEPNKMLLGLAGLLVVLVGVGVAYVLTRGGDDGAGGEVAAEDGAAEDVPAAETLEDTAAPEPDVTAVPEPVVDEPTLVFEQAQTGPLQQGETHSIDLIGEPPESLLQVVVDGLPQGEPATQLPDLILPAGRHSLFIQIANGPEQTTSTPVEVYVLGDLPAQGYRANLSSVDMQTEGWVEAIRQFDEYRAAGHEGLEMAPLVPGYWNIFVGGLGEESTGALSYCESFGLVIPDQCFGAYYEGSAEAPATTVAETTEDGATETTVEAMEDSTTVTTAAGG